MPATAQFELPSSQHRLGHQSRRIPFTRLTGRTPSEYEPGTKENPLTTSDAHT